jgi:hypothetical protein
MNEFKIGVWGPGWFSSVSFFYLFQRGLRVSWFPSFLERAEYLDSKTSASVNTGNL